MILWLALLLTLATAVPATAQSCLFSVTGCLSIQGLLGSSGEIEQVIFKGVTSLPLSTAGHARLMYNSSSGTLQVSINGGAYADIGSGGGGGGGVTSLNALTGALSIVGTANQITVSPAGASVTLATPQNIHTGASPTFVAATFSGLAGVGARCVQVDASGVISATGGACGVGGGITGSGTATHIPFFDGATSVTSDAGLIWDNAAKRLKLSNIAAGAGTNCLQIDTSGVISNTGSSCGAGGAGVTSLNGLSGGLTLADGTGNLSFSPVGATITVNWINRLAASKGGTNLDTSASTGVPSILSGTWSVAATLGAGLGGTGLNTSGSSGIPSINAGTWTVTSVTPGAVVYGSATGGVAFHASTTVDNATGDFTGRTVKTGQFPSASFPAPGTLGRLAYQTDNQRGYHIDGTTQWIHSGPSNTFNVRLYGALGNDSTDDQAAINAAAAAVCQRTDQGKGGRLYFPAGRYRISAEIAINCGMTIEGDGWGDNSSTPGGTAINTTTAAQNAFNVNAANQVVIRNLSIMTAVTKTNGAAILFSGGPEPNTSCFTQNPGSRVENVLIYKHFYGVRKTGTNQTCTAFVNKSSIFYLERGVSMSQGNGGMSVSESYLAGYVSLGTTATAVALEGIGDIRGNFIHNSAGPTTILISRTDFAEGFIINGNIIEGGTTTAGCPSCSNTVMLQLTQTTAAAVNYAITGNTFYGGFNGITMSASAGGSFSRGTITGNVFNLGENNGSCMSLTGTITNFAISGNACDGGVGTNTGIILAAGVGALSLGANTFGTSIEVPMSVVSTAGPITWPDGLNAIDVTLFGVGTSIAAGTNVTRLQAAHDALPSSGGTLILPQGTYDVNNTVTISKPVTLRGQTRPRTTGGSGSIFRITNATINFLTVTATQPVTIRDLGVTASVTRTNGSAIVLDPGAGNEAAGFHHLSNLSLASQFVGITISRGQGMVIADSYIEGRAAGIGIGGTPGTENGNHTIRNNFLVGLDASASGITIQNAPGVQIIGNRIWSPNGDLLSVGISYSHTVATQGTGLLIQNNVIEGALSHGIQLSRTNGTLVHVTITGNQFRGGATTTANGITISAAALFLGSVLIDGNNFVGGVFARALELDRIAGAVVSNNLMSPLPSATPGVAIFSTANVAETVMTGNQFLNGPTPYSGSFSGVTLHSNGPVTNAQLPPSAANGSSQTCSDCDYLASTQTCATGGGTNTTVAFRIGGAWKCLGGS